MGVAITLRGWGQVGAAITGSRSRTEDKLSAFEAMIARDWDRFHRFAYRLCAGNADDAEDLLSESLLDAFKAFDNYRGEGFDRWFFRMITNNRIDMARRAKVRRAESLDTAWTGDDGETHGREIAEKTGATEPEKQILNATYSEEVQKALDGLSDEFRAVILLSDVEEMSYEEIATTMQIPVGTVRSRIHRGRTQMRKTLESLGWRG